MKRLITVVSALVLVLAASGVAFAVTQFDQNVTPEVLFGTGVTNGSFTRDQTNSIEIGLRGKLRYDSTCQPQNTFNSNGDGTYTFIAGVAPDGPGGSADCSSSNTAVWSFEWSVNTDYNNGSGKKLADYKYEIGIDYDPSANKDYCKFDHITPGAVPFWDHSIGNNSTPNGGGTEAGDPGTYA